MKADREPTRTRLHGTPNTRTGGDPAAKLAALRQIVAKNGYAKIDGVTVDLFSASAVTQVYDALSEENRTRFLALPIERMCRVAFRLIAQQKEK
ncbi:MAG TPA: hypothetical protein VH575_12865 [Gemmataceae bacterium]